jgi:hypothetical protein
MTVEGSQCHLATTELQVVERGVDDLPVQFKGLLAGMWVIRWSRAVMVPPEVNTAIFCVLSACSRIVQAAWTRSTNLPAFQARRVVVPASQRSMIRAKMRWNSLRFCAALRRMSRASVRPAAGREQGADHRVGVELVEGGIGFQAGPAGLRRPVPAPVGRVLLAAQVAGQAAIEAEAQSARC